MREIKFRAYWNDSCYVGRSAPFTLLTIVNGQVMADRDDEGSDYEPLNLAKAIVEYTGLKDKNGVESYCKDVVDFRNANSSGYWTVDWNDTEAKYALKSVVYGEISLRLIKDGFIVGNIYENPELTNPL